MPSSTQCSELVKSFCISTTSDQFVVLLHALLPILNIVEEELEIALTTFHILLAKLRP